MNADRPDRDQDLTGSADSVTSLGRFTVRRRLPDGTVGDVIGHLLRIDDDQLLLRDRFGDTHVIRRADVLASRQVPDQPPRRRHRA